MIAKLWAVVRREYIERAGKDLQPTPKGLQVITMLDEHKIPYIAVDSDADLVVRERRAGHAVYYGDAANPEFLRRCGLAEAPALAVTMDNPQRVDDVTKTARAMRAACGSSPYSSLRCRLQANAFAKPWKNSRTRAMLKSFTRKGSVWPMPPAIVITPVTAPRR